jgi:hypothetical protein
MQNKLIVLLALIVSVMSIANCPPPAQQVTDCTGLTDTILSLLGAFCQNFYTVTINSTTDMVTQAPSVCLPGPGTHCINGGPVCEMSCSQNSVKTGYPVPITQTCAGFSQSVCLTRIGYDNGFDQWWCYWNTTHNNCQKNVTCHV